MTDKFTTPFGVMEDITGTRWGPGDGPNLTIKSWLDFIGSDYPEMKAYCSSASHLEYFEWCGLTVAYCMAKAAIKPVFGRRDIDQFLWANAWKEWGDVVHIPQKGDVVVFDWGGGHQHVTLFERDLGNGYWACRGGNQTHEVKISRFPRSACSGVRRPSVAVPVGAPPEVAVAAAARAEVAVPAAAPSSFSGAGTPLTQAGLDKACARLGVGPAELWALMFTETDPPYGGFWKDKRPQILYERHIFHRLTRGRFDGVDSNISNSTPGGYGAGGSHQYDRLSKAMSLDETAALESASWGIGQVLGQNYKDAGFSSPQELVAQHFASEDAQLLAVANEIIADGAAHALATHDWARFARIYNGPAYRENNYDVKIGTLYQRFHAGSLPDLRVRSAQMYLMYLGFHPGSMDGSWGRLTRSAMNEFQAKKGIPITDELDDATFEALKAASDAVPGGGLGAPAAAPRAVPIPPTTYTVRHNRRYRATVTLSGFFESLASNDLIADKLREIGFTEVTVTGDGSIRIAEGLWSGPDTTASIDSHLSNIIEVTPVTAREVKMALDAQQLANEIAANVHAATSAAPKPTTPASAAMALPIGADFCEIWPKAKPILELLAGIAILIPGAGATAGGVLQGLIKVGDQLSSEVCK